MGGLYRSRKNKVILGVCGGLAEYFRVDPVLIRIICVVISFSGFGILLYLAAALIMPEDRGYDNNQWSGGYGDSSYSGGSDAGAGAQSDSGFENDFGYNAESWDRPPKYESGKNKVTLGAILIGLGVLLLAKRIMPGLFDLKFTVPLLLVVIGGIIVYRGRK